MVFDRTEATDLLKTKEGATGPNPTRTHFGKKGHKAESVRDGIRYTTAGGLRYMPIFIRGAPPSQKRRRTGQKIGAASRPIYENGSTWVADVKALTVDCYALA